MQRTGLPLGIGLKVTCKHEWGEQTLGPESYLPPKKPSQGLPALHKGSLGPSLLDPIFLPRENSTLSSSAVDVRSLGKRRLV